MDGKWMTSGKILTALVMGVLLFSGCGNVQSPMAPGNASTTQIKGALTGDTQDMIALSPKWIYPTVRSMKPTVFLRIEAPFVAANGGSMALTMPADSTTGVRLESASFSAAPGALDQDRTIIMKGAYGATLTDIGVMFGPTGTVFNPLATLVMTVVGPVTDAEIAALTAYHIHNDTATAIPFNVNRIDANKVVFTVGVPGFSAYSLGDDLFPPEPGP